MKKSDILRIVELTNNRFKNLFPLKSEADNDINSKASSTESELNSIITDSVIDKVTVDYFNSSNTNLNNKINSDLNSARDNIDTILDPIVTDIDNQIESNKVGKVLKSDIDFKLDNDGQNILVSERDRIVGLLSSYTDKTELDNRVNELVTTIRDEFASINNKIDKMPSFLGESDRYDTLPKIDPNGNPVIDNDIVYLSEDDGIHYKGLYRWKNISFIPHYKIKPLTNSGLRSLVLKHLKYPDDEKYKLEIIHANTSQVTDMSKLFYNMTDFNLDISNWDTSNVTTMELMFYYTEAFNQDISNWNVSNVTTMEFMFGNAKTFNQDISNWDTSSVTTMELMFTNATNFNQDISNWDISNVTTMSSMFKRASSFNQDISDWDTSNVTTMSSMFYYASNFNQNISNWNVDNVTNWYYFREDCPLSDANTPPKFR